MEILKEIQALENEMMNWRRQLHRHPELSGQEEETCRLIEGVLREAGIDCVNVPDGGVLGFMEGKPTGRTVLLRADVDALPMDEDASNMKQPKACVSEVAGVSHACGHDAHTAMLLAAAKVLAAHRGELNGRVILYFERGEEKTGNCIRLYRWIEENHVHVDSCFALHVNPSLDSGLIAVNDGPVMAANVCFDVKIKGRSAHGSQPHRLLRGLLQRPAYPAHAQDQPL